MVDRNSHKLERAGASGVFRRAPSTKRSDARSQNVLLTEGSRHVLRVEHRLEIILEHCIVGFCLIVPGS